MGTSSRPLASSTTDCGRRSRPPCLLRRAGVSQPALARKPCADGGASDQGRLIECCLRSGGGPPSDGARVVRCHLRLSLWPTWAEEKYVEIGVRCRSVAELCPRRLDRRHHRSTTLQRLRGGVVLERAPCGNDWRHSMHRYARDGRRVGSLGLSISRVAGSNVRNRADRVVSAFRKQFVAARPPIISTCKRCSQQDAAEADSEGDQRDGDVHMASLRSRSEALAHDHPPERSGQCRDRLGAEEWFD